MSLILLTGISGFIGSHIAHLLLKTGYRVRGTVRSARVQDVQARYKAYGNEVEIVGVDDIVAGSFEDALKGVDAVIHCASPLVGKESPEDTIRSAVGGAVNILKQAEAAGIKNIVQISSIAAASSKPGQPVDSITDKDWNPTTREEAIAEGVPPFITYAASKALAERAVWEWAEKHPHVEVATILPDFNFGPFAPEYDIPDAKLSSFSTNILLYQLFYPDLPIPFNHEFVDVRDVAAVTVAALRAPPTSQVGRKRFLISADPWASSKEVVEHVSKVRPELANRFSTQAREGGPAPKHYIDISRAKEILKVEPTPWQTTVVDAYDSIVAYEKVWASKGLTPN